MRLLIDARYVRVGFHDGISRYTASLLEALYLLKQDDDAAIAGVKIVMAVNNKDQLTMLPPFPHILVHSPTGVLEPASGIIFNRYRPDVLFSPMQTVGSWGRKFKLVLTLHDLIYYSHPQPPGFLPAPIRWGWRLFHRSFLPQRILLNRADAVATVSNTTASLIRAHQLTHRPVWVIPNAPQNQAVTEVLPREKRKKQLLYMGSFMPYKNVETLLEAMKELPDFTLHLLSRIQPERKTELAPLLKENIILHHGVSEEEYSQLLHESFALLTASKDEGYGLPVVEAQSAGCPVIISDIEIFREIAPHSLRFNPEDPQEIVTLIRRLENPKTFEQTVKNGFEDTRQYNWRDSALILLDCLKTL